MKEDLILKSDDSGEGYSGFVQPRSGTLIGQILCKAGLELNLTNTGPTNLTFDVLEVCANGQPKDQFVLQPGEIKSLYLYGSSVGKNNALRVSNAHPHEEGRFILLIKDDKMRFPAQEKFKSET